MKRRQPVPDLAEPGGLIGGELSCCAVIYSPARLSDTFVISEYLLVM
jgi:hypothetical protein